MGLPRYKISTECYWYYFGDTLFNSKRTLDFLFNQLNPLLFLDCDSIDNFTAYFKNLNYSQGIIYFQTFSRSFSNYIHECFHPPDFDFCFRKHWLCLWQKRLVKFEFVLKWKFEQNSDYFWSCFFINRFTNINHFKGFIFLILLWCRWTW